MQLHRRQSGAGAAYCDQDMEHNPVYSTRHDIRQGHCRAVQYPAHSRCVIYSNREHAQSAHYQQLYTMRPGMVMLAGTACYIL